MYKELVLENPRPYDVVTLFSVRKGCEKCVSLYQEFQGVAYSYAQKEQELESPAFMGVLYYTSDPQVREIFNSHDFKTVPYLATSKQVLKRDPNADFYKTEDKWLVKASEVFET